MTLNEQFATAAMSGELETLEMLFARSPTVLPHQALRNAAKNGHESVVVYLLGLIPSYGGYIDLAYVDAAKYCHLGMMAILEPYRVHETSRFEAMEEAVWNDRIDLMRYLKRLHTDWGTSQRIFNVWLAIAARCEHKKIAMLIVSWGATYTGALYEAEDKFSSDIATVVAQTLQRWGAGQIRRAQHRVILEYAIALRPLGLQIYVELWLLEWAVLGPLKEHERVRLIERVNRRN
jgi:hypothetical protein